MRIANPIARLNEFLRTDIWRIRLWETRGARRLTLYTLRMLLIAAKEFVHDKCTLWASQLTYYSLLAIVPVFALAFAVAKGFGLETHLQNLILERTSGQEEIIARVLQYSHNLLANTKGGVLAGVGAVLLIWSVYQILDTTERAFNAIWEVKQKRTLGRKLSDYLALMLISPVLFVIASSAMVLAATQIHQVMARFSSLGDVAPLINLIFMIVPYAVQWFLLSLLYMFLPNAKVRFLSGLIGGISAGTAFVVIQIVYITFQIGVARFNAIYGSFAALPLFIVWLYVSWLIVLLGFELTYAHQHVHIYENEPDIKSASASFRMLISLQVLHAFVKNFMQGGKPLSGNDITRRLALPTLLTGEIMENLRAAGLIVAVVPEGKREQAFQPARDIDIFTIAYVQRALTHSGSDALPVAENDAFERFRSSMQAFETLIENSEANVRLKDI